MGGNLLDLRLYLLYYLAIKSILMKKLKQLFNENYDGISLCFTILLLLTGIVLYYSKCVPDPVQPSIEKPTKEIVKEQAATDKAFDYQLENLLSAQKQLLTENDNLEKKLAIAQQKNRDLGASVLATRAKNALVQTDTSKVFEIDHDSEYTQDLIAGAADSDSLCNESIQGLNKIIENKDSQLTVSTLRNVALHNSFDQVISNEFQKDAAIKSLNKKLKWQKVKGIAASALLVAAAVKIFVK